MTDRADHLLRHVRRVQAAQPQTIEPVVNGRVSAVSGLVMEATGIRLPVGAPCVVERSDGNLLEAEVVGFRDQRLFLMPQSALEGIMQGALVRASSPAPKGTSAPGAGATKLLPVGLELLGRVLDAAGRPIDGLGPLHASATTPLHRHPINPLERTPITSILDVGVRAINGLLTVGRGQRMGLFAGSGVGKSVLLGMISRFTEAQVIVVGLIGERGREVKEFIEQILGAAGLSRAVVIAAPADTPALMRLQGAAYATSIAEYFRDQGNDVLLIMDSLTRYAMAQREIALAVGEPPATKGYPPSVFAKLPTLVERAGNGAHEGGSITAFYTVLTEGDDQQDPIADAARAILDGHIVLDRRLAEAGHYPAIDIEQSISRAMHNIASETHQAQARQVKQLMSRLARSRDIINVGAYAHGSDPLLDEAIAREGDLHAYLRQSIDESCDTAKALQELCHLVDQPGPR